MGIYRKSVENMEQLRKMLKKYGKCGTNYVNIMEHINILWKILKIYGNVENCVLDGLRWAATTPPPPDGLRPPRASEYYYFSRNPSKGQI